MNEDVVQAVAEGMHEGAAIIEAEQKRLAPSPKLAQKIGQSKLFVSKNSGVRISVGYSTEAVENGALHGVILEFGRPGKRSKDGKDSKGRRIGYIAARPHIRPAFDNKMEEAMETLSEKVKEALEKK